MAVSAWRDFPKLLRRARGLQLLLLVGLLGWGLSDLFQAGGALDELRVRYGLAATAVLVPVHAIVAVSPVPSELIVIAYAAAFGFVPGCLFGWAGWMLGALLEYGLFRRAARDLSPAQLGERLPDWLRRFPASHPVFLIAGRWVPFGNHVVNAVAGAQGVSLWRFAWASALALVPSSILIAALASGLGVRP